MGSRQITRLPSASGAPLTSPGSYPPSVDRMARIWEKLAEPEACRVIGHLDTDREVVAMALAEPGRAEHGAGAVLPGYGHVSMVFVHPDMWGRGLARRPAAAGTSRACVGKRLEPHDAVDPGVERARSTPVRRPGISKVRPRDDPWQR